MKQIQYVFLIVTFLGLLSCDTKGQQPDNTIPMFGNIVKSEKYNQLDKEFIDQSLKQFGTIDSATAVHIDLAWRYFYNNDLKTAMKRFNQAWLLNADYPDSYFGFAALLEMQQNSLEAEKFYKIGLEKDSVKNRAENCYQRIADCKEQLQDIKGVIEAYNKILQLNPLNIFALKKLGYFQMESGNLELALNAYNKAIELDPNDAVTYNNRAYLYHTMKKNSNAILDYSKAIQIDNKYISAYVNRGILAMEENKFEDAKRDFETCLRLDSKSPELRRLVGLAKLNLNDKSGACEDFKEAKKLGDTQIDELISIHCN